MIHYRRCKCGQRFMGNRYSSCVLCRREKLPYFEGLSDGRLDRHSMDRDYETGPEYTLWLRGWREGQAKLRRERELVGQRRAG